MKHTLSGYVEPTAQKLAEKLGLDTLVSPRRIVADLLVSYARALQNSLGSSVETLYKLMDGEAEALEFNVKDDATADFTFRAELRDFLDGSRHTFRIGATITERASRTEVWSGTATFAK